MNRPGAVVLILLAAAGCGRAPASPAPKRAPGNVSVVPSYELRLGRQTYEHYCQTCHGEGGAGDGFNAFNLDPKPRDLSDPAFQKKKTDAELADAIRRGGGGVGLSSLMPPWGRTLSNADVDNVIRYLRSFRKS